MRAIPFGRKPWKTALALLLGAVAGVAALPAQEVSARAIVTAAPKKATAERRPDLTSSQVSAFKGRDQLQVQSFTPVSNGPLQLLLLIDDSATHSLGNQLGDLKKFLTGLPPNVETAVAYMQYGRAVLTTQGFTRDHATAVKGLRVPMGSPGTSGSPYFVISDVTRHWPSDKPAQRREIIAITDGVEGYSSYRFDPQNPYYQAAIRDAQKAGVLVYSIYFRDAGLADHFGGVVDAGQNYLSGLSHDTGGRFYYQGMGNPISLAPYLDDILIRLQNQYELSFYVRPDKDGLADLKVKIQASGLDVDAPVKASSRN